MFARLTSHHSSPALPIAPATLPASAPTTADFRVQVTPLKLDEVTSWGALLGRQPAVSNVTMIAHEGEVAEFLLQTCSIARTQGQLRQLAFTMQGAFTPQIAGPSLLRLRPLDRPSRIWDRITA